MIDGKFVNARSGKVFGTKDPRTGENLVDVAEAQEEDVDDAVKAARKVRDTTCYQYILNFLAVSMEQNCLGSHQSASLKIKFPV